MQEYLDQPLLGALLELHMSVRNLDGKIADIVVIGQVTEVETTNRWHENPALKNFIKRRGSLPNLTGVGDVTTAKVQVIGTYLRNGDKYRKERMTVPPGSGLALTVVEQKTIHDVMSDEKGIGYVGRFYGPGNLPAPVVLRHFGDFVEDGRARPTWVASSGRPDAERQSSRPRWTFCTRGTSAWAFSF